MHKILCSLLCALLFAAGAVAEGERPVTFDDLDGVKNGSGGISLGLSPDGASLALESGRNLRIYDVGTGRLSHDLGEGLMPSWSPGGATLAFYSRRSGAMQLWIWNSKSSRIRQLTNLPGGIDPDPTTRIMGSLDNAFRFDWSPDNTRLVFSSRVSLPITNPDHGAPLVLDNSTPAALTLRGVFAQPGGETGGVFEAPDGRRLQSRAPIPGQVLVSRAFIADVRAHKVHEIDSGTGHAFHPAWSPDGRQIAFAAIAENVEVFNATAGEIRIQDVATGEQRVLAGGNAIKHRPRWSKDGSQIAYLKSTRFSDHPTIVVAASASGRTLREHEPAQLVLNHEWMHDGEELLVFHVDEHAKLGRLNPGDDSIRPYSPEIAGTWSQARSGKIAWVKGHEEPSIWVWAAGASGPVKLLDLTPPTKPLRLGNIETVSYRTARGFSLAGKLLYPPDYTPGKKYPLIVDAYPLTGGNAWLDPMFGNHAWAASGYMVFKPHRARAPHVSVNCTGDPAFCDASRGPDGWDVMVDDVMSGVDHLIGRGLVDPERMCAYGYSNGGGVVDYLMTRTDRFKCAVVVAPVLPSWIGAPLLGGWWNMISDWAGVDPLVDPAAYIDLSAVFQVNNVRTPMLLAVGDKDGAFLLGAIEMYNALRFAGKEVTLLRYPNQGHVFDGPALRDLWKREMAFFARHLQRK